MLKATKKNKKYIAYLDFVGTKNSALINDIAYSDTISIIIDELKKLSIKYKQVESIMLSDSIFLSSLSREIFSLLREFRVNLFTQSIFFTCAIQKGDYELKSKNEDADPNNFVYYTFGSSDTVKVYAQQALLKGLAIDVSLIKKELNNKDYIKSYYFFNDNIKEFYDLSYITKKNENYKYVLTNYRVHINNIYKESTIQLMTNVAATKYYLTPFVSLLNCTLNAYPNLADKIFEITFELFNKQIIKENRIVLFMYAFLVNSQIDYFSNDYDVICFIRKNKENNNFKLLLKNLDTIPCQLLYIQNKKAISEIIFEIMDS